MIPRILTGRSIRGAVSYITDNTPVEDRTRGDDFSPVEQHRGRVAVVGIRNIPTEDIDLAGRIMQGVIYDAPALKRLSGGSARGRKLQDPVSHVIFSFHKTELHPQLYRLDPEHYNQQILDTVESGLAVLGLEKRQAVLAVHTDRDHIHVHVAVNRVDPETGRAAKLTQSQNRLSAWAEEYEKRHDNIVTPNRIARREARNAPAPVRWNGTRAPRRLPPMQRVRGAGRRDRTRRERGEWAKQYPRERRENAPQPVVRQQRRELRQIQSDRRDSTIRQMVGRITGRTEVPTHDQRPIRRPGPSTPGPQRHARPLQPTRPRPAPPAEKVETAAERIDRYEREERRREFERWRREEEVREAIARWREGVSGAQREQRAAPAQGSRGRDPSPARRSLTGLDPDFAAALGEIIRQRRQAPPPAREQPRTEPARVDQKPEPRPPAEVRPKPRPSADVQPKPKVPAQPPARPLSPDPPAPYRGQGPATGAGALAGQGDPSQQR